MEKIIDGIRMEIPDDATRETLLQQLHRRDDSTIYAVTPDGDHRVLDPGQSVASAPGERLGVVSRFRTGRKVSIDGQQFEVGDDATRETLLPRLPASNGDQVTIFEITPSGEHRVLNRGELLASAESGRFGTVSRWRTGTKDIDRIRAEIKLLEEVYSRERIVWSPDYSWIMIEDWRLPPKYNATHVSIIILVPDQYGYGPSYRDFFVPKGLQTRNNGGWTSLPHYFDRYPYQNLLESELVSELQRQGWSYVCVHPEHWNSSDNITTFLTQVYTFLSNPFVSWDK